MRRRRTSRRMDGIRSSQSKCSLSTSAFRSAHYRPHRKSKSGGQGSPCQPDRKGGVAAFNDEGCK
jgi:hypothetical protein